MPYLYIIALNSQTPISAEQSLYYVPDGGRSLPIIFSFANKMPETDISIEGAAKYLNGTSYVTSN